MSAHIKPNSGGQAPAHVIPDETEVEVELTRIVYSTFQSQGVTVCRDAIKPTEMHLRGNSVWVDHTCEFKHLPAYDVERDMELPTIVKPLVVLIRTGEVLPSINNVRAWDKHSAGVFTCPPEIAHLFNKSDFIWITSASDIKKIRRSDNAYREVARLVIARSKRPTKVKGILWSILRFLRLVTAVSAASTI